jgi:hypothetical protein
MKKAVVLDVTLFGWQKYTDASQGLDDDIIRVSNDWASRSE